MLVWTNVTMPYVKITAEACAAIESNRIFPPPAKDRHPDRKYADGFEIWLDHNAIELVKTHSLEGESISDAIVRLFALSAAGGRLA